MRRLFWFGLGVAVGAVVVSKVGKAARALGPAGLVTSARDTLADGSRPWAGLANAGGAKPWAGLANAGGAKPWAGLANSAAGVWGTVQDFVADIREGMAVREEQIHDAFARGEVLTDIDGADLDEVDLDEYDLDEYDDEDGDEDGDRPIR